MDMTGEQTMLLMRTDSNNLVTTARTTHLPEQEETIHMIQMLRQEAGSGAIDDLAHVPTLDCLSDSLTKSSVTPANLIKAVNTGILPNVDLYPLFRSTFQHKAYSVEAPSLQDFWEIEGDHLVRHHVNPRRRRYKPRDTPIDLSRVLPMRSSYMVFACGERQCVHDSWIGAGSSSRREWTGKTVFRFERISSREEEHQTFFGEFLGYEKVASATATFESSREDSVASRLVCSDAFLLPRQWGHSLSPFGLMATSSNMMPLRPKATSRIFQSSVEDEVLKSCWWPYDRVPWDMRIPLPAAGVQAFVANVARAATHQIESKELLTIRSHAEDEESMVRLAAISRWVHRIALGTAEKAIPLEVLLLEHGLAKKCSPFEFLVAILVAGEDSLTLSLRSPITADW